MAEPSTEDRIEYVCPLCDTHFRAGAKRAGTTIPCPACQEVVQLSPAAGQTASHPDSRSARGVAARASADPDGASCGRGLNGFSRRHAWIHLVTAVLVVGYLGWHAARWVRDRAMRATNFTQRLGHDCSTPEAGARAQFQRVADHNVDALNAVVAADQLADEIVREARLALQSMEVVRVDRWTWPLEAVATPSDPSREYAFVFVKYRRPETPQSQPPWRLRYVVLGLRRIAGQWVSSSEARERLWEAKDSPRAAVLRRDIVTWETRSNQPR